MTKWMKALVTIVIVGMVSGCAASRSVVSLDQPSGAIANPEQGVAVKIVSVTDERHFESAPKNPDTPSLSEDDIGNNSIKARAIGRKRGGFGKALGDVLLPEGQTVSDMMGGALTAGFRQANYRVLVPGDAGYDAAIPVKARVIQFWSWLQMGFWQLHAHNRAEVEIAGPMQVLKDGLTVHGGSEVSSMAVTESDWQSVASQGVKNFTENLVKVLTEKPDITE
jgi:hypothetical protein